MEIENLDKKLKEIDPHLTINKILCDNGLYRKIIYYIDKDYEFAIFDWDKHIWIMSQETNLLTEDQQRALEHFYASTVSCKNSGENKSESFTTVPAKSNNPFKDYTDHLAEILQEKNKAYGDSFGKSLDEDGLLVLKIRLGDKFNRISSLIKKNELKENDESLEDTLLDLAGYSILGLKWLKEHEDE